jgi:hypothetical protein
MNANDFEGGVECSANGVTALRQEWGDRSDLVELPEDPFGNE